MIKYGYIYKVTVNNPKSVFDGCYYIGKSLYIKDNKNYHDSSTYLKKYKKKWGLDGLIREILCDCENEESLRQTEKEYISLYQCDLFKDGGKCLNIAMGGFGGDTITNNPRYKEIITKRSQSESGKKNPMYGKNYQCYGIKNRMKKMKGKTFEEFYGEEKAKIVRQNISKGHIGLKHSEETKLKMSINNVGSKGMHWYNNGKKNILSLVCPDGFTKGQLPRKRRKI